MCEFAEVCNTVFRKARKHHKCVECGNPIEVGERYAYSSGIFDHEPFSQKECSSCHELLGYLWALPNVECIDYGLEEFLIECGHLEYDDSEDNDPQLSSVEDWLKWENNRWMLVKEKSA